MYTICLCSTATAECMHILYMIVCVLRVASVCASSQRRVANIVLNLITYSQYFEFISIIQVFYAHIICLSLQIPFVLFLNDDDKFKYK